MSCFVGSLGTLRLSKLLWDLPRLLPECFEWSALLLSPLSLVACPRVLRFWRSTDIFSTFFKCRFLQLFANAYGTTVPESVFTDQSLLHSIAYLPSNLTSSTLLDLAKQSTRKVARELLSSRENRQLFAACDWRIVHWVFGLCRHTRAGIWCKDSWFESQGLTFEEKCLTKPT